MTSSLRAPVVSAWSFLGRTLIVAVLSLWFTATPTLSFGAPLRHQLSTRVDRQNAYLPCASSPTRLLSLLVVKAGAAASTNNSLDTTKAPPSTTSPPFPTDLTPRDPWIHRAKELWDYKEKYGDTLVPKRYPENLSLANWVNRQRQIYRKHYLTDCNNATSGPLTPERVAILENMGFAWSAVDVGKASSSAHSKQKRAQALQQSWWNRFEELRSFVHNQTKSELDSGDNQHAAFRAISVIPGQSPLAFWMRQQRKEYHQLILNNTARQNLSSEDEEPSRFLLDTDKIKALESIDSRWWMNSRQRQWEIRYQELLCYRIEHGDCCVPISYTQNKKLANWVSKQRKDFNLRSAGESTDLSDERIARLNELGFAWNRWDYEFAKKGCAKNDLS